MDFNIKNCLRTAAIIYADSEGYASKRNTTIRKYIEAVFAINNNQELSLLELATAIEDDYKISFTEMEIFDTVKKAPDKTFLICESRKQEDIKISLTKERFILQNSRANKLNFQTILEEFISSHHCSLNVGVLEELLGKYFYYLLNTNIEAYGQILSPTRRTVSMLIPQDHFSMDECRLINEFLDWENSDKNRLVVSLISLSIEYAFLSNHIDAKKYCNSLSNKNFYLDTNLIFRGLGLNGDIRKKRVEVFLDKCHATGQKLFITKFTKDEFFATITYKIAILKKYPFEKSNPEIFNQYGGDDFYSFYHEWRKDRIANGIILFEIFIKKLYSEFCQKHEIKEDYSIPFCPDENATKKIIDQYTYEIQNFKSERRKASSKNDALNVFFTENKRGSNNSNIIDTKYYLITADHGLKKWDDNHSTQQPLMLLPSQWLGLVFKYTGRATSDDFQCFMSFLRLKSEKTMVIDSDRLQIVVAGISEVSSDPLIQKNIVDDLILSQPDLWKCSDDIAYSTAHDFALQKVINQYQNEINLKSNALNSAADKYAMDQLAYHQKRILEIQNIIESITKRKNNAERKIKNIRNFRLTTVLLAILGLIIIFIVLLKKEILQPNGLVFTLFSMALACVEFLISCLMGKKFDFDICYRVFSIDYITPYVYQEYDINLCEIDDLEQEKQRLITKKSSLESHVHDISRKLVLPQK